jgi:hypothetical protein
MNKTYLWLISALLLTMVCAHAASWASTKPSGERTVGPPHRTKKGVKSKPAPKVLTNSDTELMRLQNEWGHIRFAEVSQKAKDRWIRAMFQGKIPAETTLSRSLEIEVFYLREKLESLRKERNFLCREATHTTRNLQKEECNHEDLAAASLTYLMLQEEYESVKSALAAARETNRSLLLEKETLTISRRLGLGVLVGLVFILGWLAGFLMGRRRKKRHLFIRIE